MQRNARWMQGEKKNRHFLYFHDFGISEFGDDYKRHKMAKQKINQNKKETSVLSFLFSLKIKRGWRKKYFVKTSKGQNTMKFKSLWHLMCLVTYFFHCFQLSLATIFFMWMQYSHLYFISMQYFWALSAVIKLLLIWNIDPFIVNSLK